MSIDCHKSESYCPQTDQYLQSILYILKNF